MKYINFEELDDRDFIILLQNIKRGVSIYDDPYTNDYPLIIRRIDKMLKKGLLNGYDLKSIKLSKSYIKSLKSLYEVDKLIDNKNNLSQEEIDNIYKNMYLYKDNYKRIFYCIGKKNSLVVSHIHNIKKINNMDKYYEVIDRLNNFYNGYTNSTSKSNYFKDIYKNNIVDLSSIENDFNILLDYYTKSLFDTKFYKVYKEYPMDKLLDIDRIIISYRTYIDKIKNFLNSNTPIHEHIDFNLVEFINKYNSYKEKEDFFSYLYIHDNITDNILNKYINYYKYNYLKNNGIKYTDELSILYKVSKIYDEYKLFIDNLDRPSTIDKDIIDSYLNNKDIDYMFFDLLKNNKLNRPTINNIYDNNLSEEELTKYYIIISFINNRIVTISSNEIFKERIILSNPKNKKLYYDYMIQSFFNRKFKPSSKYVKFNKRGLTKEEMKVVSDFEDMYSNYYDSMMKDTMRTHYVSTKEVSEIVKPDKEQLLSILDKILSCDKQYRILEFYKVSPYSVPIFFNLVRPYVSVSQKIEFYSFYTTYKDDIAIDEIRINNLLEKDKMKYIIDNTEYTVTREDKEQVLLLLQEENIPITNRTYYTRLRKYVLDNKDILLNNKVLTMK